MRKVKSMPKNRKTYLVRTIQRDEDPVWVRGLKHGKLPLPFALHRKPLGLIVIHGSEAYVFEKPHISQGNGKTMVSAAKGKYQ
jgi:hypothetical protein